MRSWEIAGVGALIGALATLSVLFAAKTVMPVNEAGIHAYLMGHPELVDEMSQKLQKQQAAQKVADARDAMKKIGLAAFFDPKIAFTVGPKTAKKTLVEFYDYNCPYCRASVPAVMRYAATHMQDTRISFIEFPIKGGQSVDAARFALAARYQPEKFLALHYALMNEQSIVDNATLMADAKKVGLDMDKLKADMQRPDVMQAVNASHALAVKAGIDGTPTFIVNGVMHAGALDDVALAKLMG